MSPNLTMSNELSDEDIEKIHSNLSHFNAERSDGLSRDPGISIQLVLKDDNGEIQGALWGRAIYKSFMIDVLWIAEDYRDRGNGGRLVANAEKVAKEHGCISAQTSTYSFQAPEFYRGLGYELFGKFEGYPSNIKKYYFGKTL
ncbi:GNAT family N-acetyltransferase [Candidatus Thorarchaeota archaeon]|nr:MAG: GNAT family N-acetyltransferase [Candidatus Thorarchaeota archaeon]